MDRVGIGGSVLRWGAASALVGAVLVGCGADKNSPAYSDGYTMALTMLAMNNAQQGSFTDEAVSRTCGDALEEYYSDEAERGAKSTDFKAGCRAAMNGEPPPPGYGK